LPDVKRSETTPTNRAGDGLGAVLGRNVGPDYLDRSNSMGEEAELRAAIKRIMNAPSRKKLIVAGPGTGKTTLFKQMLEASSGEPDRRIVLTFINNLKDDLEEELSGLALVFTLHSYCLGLLHRNAALRAKLSPKFQCYPGLASLIKEDWKFIEKSKVPHFVSEMRNLTERNHIPFYLVVS
jgi:superfamily I DNA/RNA helicase